MQNSLRNAFTPNAEHSATFDRMVQDYKNVYKPLKKAYKQSNEARFANQNEQHDNR